jgi:predicted metal-binding membrane protein
MTAVDRPASPKRPLPAAVPVAIALCWAAAIAAELSGNGSRLHHDALIHSTLPPVAALGVSVAAWQVMIGAMMLPSSVPMIRLFAATAPTEARATAVPAFIGGYALVWTGFGTAAFILDTGVHRIVDASPWLDQRPWLIGGATLALAGVFQFSPLKQRCLELCRHPAAYLLRHYRRGTVEAFHIGRGHGLSCLGCCWALMLVMFAAGISNLAWMAALAGIMTYEKIGRRGRQLAPVVGVVLLAWAVLMLAHPAWLPHAIAGPVFSG